MGIAGASASRPIPADDDAAPDGDPLVAPSAPSGEGVRDSTCPRPEVPSGAWHSITARVRGAQHVRDERPCQDALECRDSGDRRALAVAVADGHGSASRAEDGANCAVCVGVSCLLDFHERVRAEHEAAGYSALRLGELQSRAMRELGPDLLRQWQAEIERASGDGACKPHEFGTTLLLALATDTYTLLGQLGDGDVVVLDAGTTAMPLHVAGPPQGEETWSMAHLDPLRFCWTVLPALGEDGLFCLSTDGFSKSYRQGSESLPRRIRARGAQWRERAEEFSEGFAPWLWDVSEKGSGDDIAMVLVRRRGPIGALRSVAELPVARPVPERGAAPVAWEEVALNVIGVAAVVAGALTEPLLGRVRDGITWLRAVREPELAGAAASWIVQRLGELSERWRSARQRREAL